MSSKSFVSKLRKLESAVLPGVSNPLESCLQTPMPSVNWAFGIKGWGLPFGYGMILYGPPKGGKSIIANSMVGWLHQNDEEAIAITFNTELRGAIQNNVEQMKVWGIDPDRFVVYDTNAPEQIFDVIEKDIAAACQEGAKIKAVIIDSLSNITGRRTQNATTVLQQQIGDQAQTLKDGLQRILPTIRKYGIALIMTAHVRAEMDQQEQMRGNTVKMHAAFATKHLAEFFCYVEPNRSKAGRVSLAGEEFTDKDVVDFMDKEQKIGHKIRFTVKESSLGKSGRTAEFTLNYDSGVVNQYEEIFTLGKIYNVIERPNNQTYVYDGKSYRGLVNFLTALRDDTIMQASILNKVKELDRKESPAKDA